MQLNDAANEFAGNRRMNNNKATASRSFEYKTKNNKENPNS